MYKKRAKKSKGPSVYEIVTEKIIEMLKQGVIPWQKPWTCGGPTKNLISKKEYRGINRFLLGFTPYMSPYFLTLNQINQLKGKLKEGESKRYHIVTFWKWLEPKNSMKDKLFEGKELDESQAGGKSKNARIPFLRYYRVYNVEQTEGIDYPQAETRTFEQIEQADTLVKNMPLRPEIVHEGTRACYSPGLDLVKMPSPEFFESDEKYYGVLFHELVHSTGHVSRLKRGGVMENHFFGSESYSKEELVAEIGAAFLCSECDIERTTINNSAAYINSWLQQLENDEKLIVQAAAAAEKAADFIKGVTYDGK